ncbi:Argonaute siRNA chaperone complex subunit Arb1-domain-containing protein [Lipomyces kononenkoae]
MDESDHGESARNLARADQTGSDMAPEGVTVEPLLEESRSGTVTPDNGENNISASAAEVGPAPAKKKKKPRKNKSKSQKALAIGTGFEECYADNPVRPEEWAQERQEYDPTKHSFRERIDACLVRYKKKRFLDKHRARIFQVYLSFAKIYKPKAENQTVGGEVESYDEDGNAVDGQRLHKSSLGGYDEVLDAEDLSLRSKKFFAHHLPFELFLTREAPLQEAITVVENFVRYLLFHEVCPEFNSALDDTLHFAKLSRRELPAAVKLINGLPGHFNTAVSYLLGGQFGHHNPSLANPIYDQWLDAEIESDMLAGTGDAIPIDLSAEISKQPKDSGLEVYPDDNNIAINPKEQEALFEFKDDLDLSELENLSDNENDVNPVEAGQELTNGHTAGIVQTKIVTEESHDKDDIPDKNESAKKDVPIAPIQESFERWQQTAPKVEFEQDMAWKEDKEFEERMNPETEEPWEEIPVTSTYDFRMTESEAREAVVKALFKDVSGDQLERISSLYYVEEYSLPVEVVEIHFPPEHEENALGEMMVIPWWHVLEDESTPDDCPFTENEKIILHLERKVLNDVFTGMKMEVRLKRLSDGSLERSGNKGIMVFDHVTRIMCSFYINSSPTGD